jgi:hypothetical protein
MATFLELLANLQASVISLLTQNFIDEQISLEVTLAFKDIQIKLLEETKKVSGFEFVSSLKQSFIQKKQGFNFAAGQSSA